MSNSVDVSGQVSDGLTHEQTRELAHRQPDNICTVRSTTHRWVLCQKAPRGESGGRDKSSDRVYKNPAHNGNTQNGHEDKQSQKPQHTLSHPNACGSATASARKHTICRMERYTRVGASSHCQGLQLPSRHSVPHLDRLVTRCGGNESTDR